MKSLLVTKLSFVFLQRIADSLSQLDELLATLEQSIKDIIKDCEAKKKVSSRE